MPEKPQGDGGECYSGEADYTWRIHARIWALSVKPVGWAGWAMLVMMAASGPMAIFLFEGLLFWLVFVAWAAWLYQVFLHPLYTTWQIKRRASPVRYGARVDAAGMHFGGSSFEVSYDWQHFTAFKMSNDVILLYAGSEVQQWLTAEFFGEQWPAVQRLVARRLGKCGRCGYLLAGSQSDTCPECGTPLSEARSATALSG